MSQTERDTKYTILKFLGSGSYAKVYKCKTPSNEIVAVKKIKCEDQKSTIDANKEVKTLKTFNNENIVKFIRNIDTSKISYIVMECCDYTLHSILKNRGKITIPEIKYCLMSICNGLDYMHRLGYIHRDIKLRNILVDNDSNIKIGDLGFCIHKNNVRLGRVAGTPNYLSPELIKDEKSRKEDDIWSTGIIIYNLYYGKSPWPNVDKYEVKKYITGMRIYYEDKSTVYRILKHILVSRDSRYTIEDILNSNFLNDYMCKIRFTN